MRSPNSKVQTLTNKLLDRVNLIKFCAMIGLGDRERAHQPGPAYSQSSPESWFAGSRGKPGTYGTYAQHKHY